MDEEITIPFMMKLKKSIFSNGFVIWESGLEEIAII